MRALLLALVLACTSSDAMAPAPPTVARAAIPVTWTATGGTITQDGLWTSAGVPGAHHVIASGGGFADTAEITITEPGPPPPPPDTSTLPFAPPPPAPVRVVPVSTNTALGSAINTAQPGDEIRLAAGTYSGGFIFPLGRGGTAPRPIVIRCSAGAVLNGGGTVNFGFKIKGPYWQVRDCRLTGFRWNIWVEPASDASGFPLAGYPDPVGLVFDNNELDHACQNLIVLTGAHDAYVQRNRLHHTGGCGYTEGIYGGSSSSDPRAVRLMTANAKILGNVFGPGIESEHIDIKGYAVTRRSAAWLTTGNTFDATGTIYRSHLRTPPSTIYGVYSDQGCDGCRVVSNRMINVTAPGLNGYWWDTSVRAYADSNSAAGSGFGVLPSDGTSAGAGYKYSTSRPTQVTIKCSNVGSKPQGCTP